MTVTRCLCVLITLLLASSQSKGGNFGRSEDRYNPQHIETSVHSVFGYGLGWSTKMCQPNMREFYTTTLPSLSVRIDLDTDSRIGPGKIQLLENIRACGSISAAGRAMDMSYKRAWALVDEMNRICGRAAVERQVGGKNGGGAILTPFGLSLVVRYRKIEHSVESAARKELLELLADMDGPKKA